MKPRVILIRENAETLTCSSCAGNLDGIEAFGSLKVPDYSPSQRIISQVADLYMALRREFEDAVEVDVVDPRNEVYLIPRLIADYKRYKPPLGKFLKTLLLGISPKTVVVNGVALYTGELPTPQKLVEEVRSCLDTANASTK